MNSWPKVVPRQCRQIRPAAAHNAVVVVVVLLFSSGPNLKLSWSMNDSGSVGGYPGCIGSFEAKDPESPDLWIGVFDIFMFFMFWRESINR